MVHIETDPLAPHPTANPGGTYGCRSLSARHDARGARYYEHNKATQRPLIGRFRHNALRRPDDEDHCGRRRLFVKKHALLPLLAATAITLPMAANAQKVGLAMANQDTFLAYMSDALLAQAKKVGANVQMEVAVDDVGKQLSQSKLHRPEGRGDHRQPGRHRCYPEDHQVGDGCQHPA